MSLAAALWADNADLAAAALASPFVRGLADGMLLREDFAGYVGQDAFFLESFARAYALGVAHSPDRTALDTFADLLEGVREELRLHASYAHEWDIDLASVEPLPATLAYTDFLLTAAGRGEPGQICAAMTPCMRLYAYLGQSLAHAPSNAYAEWVTTYADPVFEELTTAIERLLDTYAEDTAEVRTTYRRAMQLEVAFFDAACSSA